MKQELVYRSVKAITCEIGSCHGEHLQPTASSLLGVAYCKFERTRLICEALSVGAKIQLG